MKPGPQPGRSQVSRPEVVGFVDERALAIGFVRAFEQACRDGVPVQLRADVRAYRGSTGVQVVDTTASVRARLIAEIAENERVRDNVLAAVASARSPQMVSTFVASAEKADALVVRLRGELAALQESVAQVHDPGSFETPTAILTDAMRGLLASPRMTRAEADAFRRIVTDMRLEPVADGWRAQAYVRMLVAQGLAVLGPIVWEVAAERVGVGAMRANARDRALPVLDPPETTEAMLVHDAHITRRAAHVLAGAPSPELAQLVLHKLAGTPLPDWIGPQWRHPAFVQHVVNRYADPDFQWSRAYGRLSMSAQARVDAVAAAGRLTLVGFRHRYPGVNGPQLFLTPTAKSRIPGMFDDRDPVVVEATEDGTRYVRSVVCSCGRNATTLVRGPEIPGGLLCECGVAPFAEPGTPAAEVVFPPEYQLLRVSPETADRAMRRRYGRRGDPLTAIAPMEKTVLRALLRDSARGWSASEVAETCDVTRRTVLMTLRRLTRREFVHYDKRLGLFAVTDVDDALAVLERRSNRAA
jgi:hypothetical protein